MKKAMLLAALLLSGTAAEAAGFYCSSPSGNGYVNPGDSMAQVQATCGVPTAITQQQTPSVTQQKIQSWTYSPPVLTGANPNTFHDPIYGQQVKPPSEQAPTTSFQIINDQVAAINSSQQGSVQQYRCPASGQMISIGSSTNALAAACGQPALINTTSQQINVQPHVMANWTYQANQYSTPVVMQFQDGILVQVK